MNKTGYFNASENKNVLEAVLADHEVIDGTGISAKTKSVDEPLFKITFEKGLGRRKLYPSTLRCFGWDLHRTPSNGSRVMVKEPKSPSATHQQVNREADKILDKIRTATAIGKTYVVTPAEFGILVMHSATTDDNKDKLLTKKMIINKSGISAGKWGDDFAVYFESCNIMLTAKSKPYTRQIDLPDFALAESVAVV